jgi:hypothetical protein
MSKNCDVPSLAARNKDGPNTTPKFDAFMSVAEAYCVILPEEKTPHHTSAL